MAKVQKYGFTFDTSITDANGHQVYDALGMEMHCIRKGEEWLKKHGLSISTHFENARKIIWPELDDHRWHNLCRDEILTHKVCVLLGCGSSGKTFSASWISLLDYWCFPEITCVLVSSTDIRGLRKRVWGEIVDLWEKGVERFPKLSGHLLDSAIAITTDDIEDCEPGKRRARDMRRGIFGVPCVSSGSFVGLSKFLGIKQKRMRLVADEACFPAGQMVDTPSGARPIEDLRLGDLVSNCLGSCRVIGVMKKRSFRMVRIKSSDGRIIECTPTHPFFTQKGWVCACELDQSHYMLSHYEAMQILRGDVQASVAGPLLPAVCEEKNGGSVRAVRRQVHKARPEFDKAFLQSLLLVEAHASRSGVSEKILHPEALRKDLENAARFLRKASGEIRSDETVHLPEHGSLYGISHTTADAQSEAAHEQNSSRHGAQAISARRQRDRENKAGKGFNEIDSGIHMELCREDRHEGRIGIPPMLQAGFGHTGVKVWSGGRRTHSQLHREERARQEEGGIPIGAWVDSVEVQEQENFGTAGGSEGGIDVYNIEVEGHPSYSVNGLLVHNSMMGSSFLSAFANLNKNEDFRAIVLGNPNDPLDPLGKAAEPKDGWTDDYLEPTKTACWDTRFMNGRCVNLVGLDSPNMDFPADQPTRYKYLISREKIADTLSFFPKDSIEYYSQCVGTMKIGTMAKRVLTRAECSRFKAQEQPKWLNSERTLVYFVDAAYGGDRCVGGSAEFGKDVDGKQILSFNIPKVIPITVAKKVGNEDYGAEDQIAMFVRDDCNAEGIPASHMGHDSTGHGALGTALARAWSPDTNPIDAGGSPTKRPVSHDLQVLDEETGQMRLKRCDEHFDRLVSEFNFMMRLAVQSGQIRGLPDECMEEFCARRWDRIKGDKYWVEPKDKPSTDPLKMGFKQRMGRSPDMADWAAGILEMARRKGFVIAGAGNNTSSQKKSNDWYDKEAKRIEELRRSRQLQAT